MFVVMLLAFSLCIIFVVHFPFFDLVNPMQLVDFKNINEVVGNGVENFDL